MRGSLALYSYKQPLYGNKIRCGAVSSVRDTQEQPLLSKSIQYSSYRYFDKDFKRSQMLIKVAGLRKVKSFYAERVEWALIIPFIGYPLLWFQKLNSKSPKLF